MGDLRREVYRVVKKIIKEERIEPYEGVITDIGVGFNCLIDDPSGIERPIIWAVSVDGSRQNVYYLAEDNLSENEKSILRQNAAFYFRKQVIEELERQIRKNAEKRKKQGNRNPQLHIQKGKIVSLIKT